jgi:hypothetical protein
MEGCREEFSSAPVQVVAAQQVLGFVRWGAAGRGLDGIGDRYRNKAVTEWRQALLNSAPPTPAGRPRYQGQRLSAVTLSRDEDAAEAVPQALDVPVRHFNRIEREARLRDVAGGWLGESERRHAPGRLPLAQGAIKGQTK